MAEKNQLIVMIFLVVVIFLILLLIGFIVTILFLYQRKQFRFAREIEMVKMNYDKEIFKSQLEMQEQTFLYISQEIHDNIGQFISLAKLNLNTLNVRDEAGASICVAQATDLLTRALGDLRDLSKSLSAELIKTDGLVNAVELQVAQILKTGSYRVIYELMGNYQYLDFQKEIILFRMLQEAITNIFKHSKAKTIWIKLSYGDGKMQMTIEDDGVGFDDRKISGEKGISGTSGMNNMQRRARMINASLNVNSEPAKGTKISISTLL